MSNIRKLNRKLFARIFYYIFIILIPVAAHLLFSSLGYNPTDDGVYLALSRRILDGEIPHKDFLTYQPIGSAFLYLPFLFLPGDYTYWITRFFVWIEFAIISFIWMKLIIQLLNLKIGKSEKLLFVILSFMFSAHSFPVMAWYTIDGLLFVSLGFYLIIRENKSWKFLGYFLIATAYIFKQSFILLAPVGLILLKDYLIIRYWAASFLPALIYIFYLQLNGALSLALDQYRLVSNSYTFINTGIKNYLSNKYFVWGLFTGFFLRIFQLNFKFRIDNKKLRINILLLLVLITIPFIISIYLPENFYTFYLSFTVFGLVCGLTLFYISNNNFDKAKIGLITLIVAWSVSLSLGYYNPALFTGPLIIFILASSKEFMAKIIPEKFKPAIIFRFLLIALTAVTINSFMIARRNYIYREKSARYLNYPLDMILPGGNLINTNDNTFKFINDLAYAVSKTDNLPYVILPDFPGYWVKSEKPNPTRIYWANFCNISVCGTDSKNIYNTLITDLESQRGNLIIILSKVSAANLADGIFPFKEDKEYPISSYIAHHFKKITETEYFNLFK